MVKIANLPDIKSLLAANATDPLTQSPEEFGAFVRQEVEKWAKVVEFAGITVK